MTPRFFLWLMPPAAVRDRFARLIDVLSRRLGTAQFEPHITLSGSPDAGEAEAVSRATTLAARLAPVPVRLVDVGYSDAYFRCLYVRAERSPELLAAHRTACAHLGRPPDDDFMPHLSLVYGNLSETEKEKIIEEIGRRFDTTFLSDRIALCLPAGPPDGWRLVGPFTLAGR